MEIELDFRSDGSIRSEELLVRLRLCCLGVVLAEDWRECTDGDATKTGPISGVFRGVSFGVAGADPVSPTP